MKQTKKLQIANCKFANLHLKEEDLQNIRQHPEGISKASRRHLEGIQKENGEKKLNYSKN